MLKKTICISTVLFIALTVFTAFCFSLDLNKDIVPIASVSDLNALHQAVTNDVNHDLRDKKFVLVKDIKGFKGSIGNSGFPFISEFDGCGHTIELKDSNGVFYNILGGTVKNLIVKGTVFGTGYIGGIAERIGAGTRIVNCSNYATVTTNYPVAGGIVGNAVKNGNTVAGTHTEGDILGERDPKIVIENCANYGVIKASSFAGAICGKVSQGKEGYTDQSAFNSTFLLNCYFGGTVNGEVKDNQSYVQLNQALDKNSEYLPWIDKDNDGIPELNYSLARGYAGSLISSGNIAIIVAIIAAAAVTFFVIKKKKR